MCSKNQQELVKFLGPEYSIKVIDACPCVYRKINSHYDIEISGALRKHHPICVFVWSISGDKGIPLEIVERYFDISDWASLKALLDELTKKYQGLA